MKNSITAKLALLGLLCLIALGLGAYAGLQKQHSHTHGAETETGTGTGATATLGEIELPDVDKNLRSGGEWLGKVVVVNHWASWCPPCREEIPLLVEYQQHFGERGVQIIGIAHDSLDTARAHTDSMGINYPSLVAIADGGKIMRRQGNTPGGLPFTVFFDRHGNLAAHRLGKISRAELERIVTPLL